MDEHETVHVDDLDTIDKFWEEANNLLKDAVKFMNQVPNNKYGDNYELCSRIDNFLKEVNGDDIK